MRYRLTSGLRVFICLALLSCLAPGVQARWFPLPVAVPGSDLPVVQEYRYRMKGRVRALLAFWISRDNVGGGVIRVRRSGDRVAYEVVMGSDPSRAPRGLNRWGYLAEEVQETHATIVGVITNTYENEPGEVEVDIGNLASRKIGQAPDHADADAWRPISTIRARVAGDGAYANVAPIRIPTTFTVGDADDVIASLLALTSSKVTPVERPADVRAGFLTAVTEVIHETVQARRDGSRLDDMTVPYVYGEYLYDLRMVDADPVERFARGDVEYERLIRTRFEIHRRNSDKQAKFDLLVGTEGPLAEVPVLISYKPRWWLHIELLLEDHDGTSLPRT